MNYLEKETKNSSFFAQPNTQTGFSNKVKEKLENKSAVTNLTTNHID